MTREAGPIRGGAYSGKRVARARSWVTENSPGTFVSASTRKLCTASVARGGCNMATSSSWDVGVFKDGWVGDTAKTVAVGIHPPFGPKAPPGDGGGFELAIPFAREGNRLHMVSSTIEKYVVEHGFSVVREFVRVTGSGANSTKSRSVPNYKSGDNPKLRAGIDPCHRADG